eukprot:3877677-Prymnesium_polylepis.1
MSRPSWQAAANEVIEPRNCQWTSVISGAIDYYSPENVAKRRALRTHPKVQLILDVWWNTAARSLEE